MACESCRLQSRSLLRTAMRAAVQTRSPVAGTNSFLRASAAAAAAAAPSSAQTQNRPSTVRQFSSTTSRRLLGRFRDTYEVLGATERLAKDCMAPADYCITKEQRKRDEVEVLEDGEEVGRSINPGNIWHTTFNLKSSFSTWSHVSMLHIYLLNTRIRCFDRDGYRSWHQQLIDHFFFECEKKMHVDHNITSSALRQRYLKDIFTQFRGLLLAYDEGLVKGDAVLASALWRNLFKGDPDADPRALAAIVAWVRSTTQTLEGMSDLEFPVNASKALLQPVKRHWNAVAGATAGKEQQGGNGAKNGTASERPAVKAS